MLTSLLVASHLLLANPAVAIAVSGDVQVETGASRRTLARFDEIPEGSKVITGAKGSVQVRTASGSLLRLGPNTQIALDKLEHKDPPAMRKESVRLVVGRVWARVSRLFGSDSEFHVETQTAVAGVRGTSFLVEATPESSRFVLLEGAIELLRDDAKLRLDRPGAFADATGAGLGVPGLLDTDALTQLQRATGGAAAAAITQLASRGASKGGGSTNRAASRADIMGPGALVDSPVAATPSLGTPAGEAEPAIVNITINLP